MSVFLKNKILKKLKWVEPHIKETQQPSNRRKIQNTFSIKILIM